MAKLKQARISSVHFPFWFALLIQQPFYYRNRTEMVGEAAPLSELKSDEVLLAEEISKNPQPRHE